MKYITVLITPEEEVALSNSIGSEENKDTELAQRWLAYVRTVLASEYANLPQGSHLKAAYRDQVWTWDDTDLY